jgi:hypothetical protein
MHSTVRDGYTAAAEYGNRREFRLGFLTDTPGGVGWFS